MSISKDIIKQTNKQIGIKQKAIIIDEDKRIMAVKASDDGYDRDGDRISTKGWRLPGYNPPVVDSHKTHETSDNRLGEIVNAYTKDGFYWNEIQFDAPSEEDPNKWTDGEKLANRVWNNAKAGKDIRVSVGFIPDYEGLERNEKGGIDFKTQEQTEISVVLMPSNSRAGNKQAGSTDEDEDSDILFTSDNLKSKISAAIKAHLGITKGLYVYEMFLGEVVYNQWGKDLKGEYFDKEYRIKYDIKEGSIAIDGDPTEVQWTSAFRNVKQLEDKNIAKVKELQEESQSKDVKIAELEKVTKSLKGQVNKKADIDYEKIASDAVNKIM